MGKSHMSFSITSHKFYLVGFTFLIKNPSLGAAKSI